MASSINMNLNIIYNKDLLNDIAKGSIITIIKDADSKKYRFVGFCPFDELSNTIMFSNPNESNRNELFRFHFRYEKDEVWIIGDALRENREAVIFQIVSQLKHKRDGLKNSLNYFESKQLNFIWNSKELKLLNSKTPITIIKNGRIINLCYLTYIDEPKMFLFCDYAILNSPPIPDFLKSDIYSGKSFKVGIESDYELLKDDYNVYLSPVIVNGIFGNYNCHCKEIYKIQIFQLENLISSYLGLEQSSLKAYKELLFECDAKPF
ncbi:hypothetical protein CHU92_00315 [Flavobacterium cyanobacteriorum]|uniref:Uncharacterized protein n=1 Tax=Flavobacterium cyanobacteriorum TaxID=2022802 RepID=A0A256A8X5_9FLAO|nr:hypothetical protein [Flavobacterium cyanobacteriorum]OYQ49645.1 hypothetical protein CHU92_00315 [Flavobacterium cyanobacteriorum]